MMALLAIDLDMFGHGSAGQVLGRTDVDRVENQSPSYLKKHLKPTSLCCFSNFGSPFPKSRLTIISSLQRKIVPLLDVDVASPSPFNQIFVHDRRLTKPESIV
ncbi:unnamed protein product [Arabidopsis thaliana]|uniref:Uncharacterized protein n=1 Tax=Arabidopsis thaliana TaxID=3702 RepID=A0A5S9XPK1_ARATH|nr:unnamed protein product [Arabidopsis thaliana]